MATKTNKTAKKAAPKEAAKTKVSYPAKYTAQAIVKYIAEKHAVPRAKAQEIIDDVFDVIVLAQCFPSLLAVRALNGDEAELFDAFRDDLPVDLVVIDYEYFLHVCAPVTSRGSLRSMQTYHRNIRCQSNCLCCI